MQLPNNEKISRDIFQLKNKLDNNSIFNRKSVISDNYYENFIKFLKNSFEYNDTYQYKKTNIVDYVDNFHNLEFFSRIINRHNVYTIDTPSILILYLSDDNETQTLTKNVTDMQHYNLTNIINKHNKIILLYMVRDNGKGIVRFVELDDDKRYIQFDVKKRKSTERRKKLKQIDDTI